ncbi:D-glycerate 3-kinase, chloroplastic isoform X2 [Syzygium oleosum]|uniref:D-glycerate 3-kinase, chloroplastic isoform X2 n=1 Tax=Syzygium oleosum TaxID=219896 RepID=UPI0024BAF36B|nr:D-glycerate 3-kinase, chloroplastic isoform X2 [Syzygium oleosum]
MAVLSALSPPSTAASLSACSSSAARGDGPRPRAAAPCRHPTGLAPSARPSEVSPSPLRARSGALPAATDGCSWMQGSSIHRQTGGTRWRLKPVYSIFPTKPAQVSSVQDLFDFICSGPLFDKLGLNPEKVAESLDKWLAYGLQLSRLFQLNELYLTVPQKARFYHYYIPVFLWCEDQIAQHYSKFKEGEDIPPLVAKLREENPGNALLELRGNAGSHDLQFSVETLTAVTNLTKEGMKMKLPRYDKSAYNGKGDRADPSTWPEVEGPLTAVLFEGWMLGFKPLPADVVKAVDPQLETVNKNLEAYYDAWDKFVKAWIIIKIQDPSWVYQWRLQAEIAMREAGNPGMSDEEVKDFVSRYLPGYKAYLSTLYSEGPKGSDPEHLLVIEIDEGRNPL